MKDDVYIDVDPIQVEVTLSWILSDSSQSGTLFLSIDSSAPIDLLRSML
jgi:hypothetical protein